MTEVTKWEEQAHLQRMVFVDLQPLDLLLFCRDHRLCLRHRLSFRCSRLHSFVQLLSLTTHRRRRAVIMLGATHQHPVCPVLLHSSAVCADALPRLPALYTPPDECNTWSTVADAAAFNSSRSRAT